MWRAFQEPLFRKFILIRPSSVAKDEVEAYSVDGKTPLFGDSENDIEGKLQSAITNQTYVEWRDRVISGNYFLKANGLSKLPSDQRWWGHSGKKFLQEGSANTWYENFQTVPPGGPHSNFRVTIDMSSTRSVDSVPENNNFPDGVMICTPLGNGSYIMFMPEQINYRSISTNPQYESVPKSAWMPVPTLGSWSKNLTWPGLYNSPMAVWLFAFLKIPSQPGKFIGLLHAEHHPVGQAPPCYKGLMITYSSDNGVTFTAPQTIITYPPYSSDRDGRWGGAGDPCMIWHEAGKRWITYFYSADNGNGIGIAISQDPQGAPGTWKLMDASGQFTIDALNPRQPYKTLNLSGGNPHVVWSKYLGQFLMVVGQWQDQNQITFSVSKDGVEWGPGVKLPFSGKGWTPLYPSLLGTDGGGSLWVGGQNMIVYYADSTQNGTRKMMKRNLTISF